MYTRVVKQEFSSLYDFVANVCGPRSTCNGCLMNNIISDH